MKTNYLKLMTLLMVIALLIGACSKDEDDPTPNDNNTAFDGTYSGFAYEGATRVASWEITISNGVVTGVTKTETDNVIISGSVDAQGAMTATTVDGDGHTLNITATISGNKISGTWIDTVEGDNGTLIGSKITSTDLIIFNGTYSGYAYEGATRVASWEITISNGVVSGISTTETDNVLVSGSVNAQGTMTATVVDGDGHTLNVTATISGNKISGTWIDTVEGDNGTLIGSKITSADLIVFNGTYTGFAYEGATKVASWEITISNGVVAGISTTETDNVIISGSVNAQGAMTATTVDGDGHTLNVTATISGNNITGTWIDTIEGDNGTLTGSKIN
ncbi:MAG: hypothetical protein K9J13_01930 [Saprospiraceae bacterium]|nr:hypothetical protein [Saprospiraceae bacterium]